MNKNILKKNFMFISAKPAAAKSREDDDDERMLAAWANS